MFRTVRFVFVLLLFMTIFYFVLTDHLGGASKETLMQDPYGTAKVVVLDLASVFGFATVVFWQLGLRGRGWWYLTWPALVAVPAHPVGAPAAAYPSAQVPETGKRNASDPARRPPETPPEPRRGGPSWHGIFRVLYYLCWGGVMLGCNLRAMIQETPPATQADQNYVMLMFLAFPLFLIGILVFGLLSLIAANRGG